MSDVEGKLDGIKNSIDNLGRELSAPFKGWMKIKDIKKHLKF